MFVLAGNNLIHNLVFEDVNEYTGTPGDARVYHFVVGSDVFGDCSAIAENVVFAHNAFLDMHDVGDALVRAGFADPVMDVEHIRLTYPDVRSLMRDIKGVGAHNATEGRARGLTGRGALRALEAAYEGMRDSEGRLPLTYEVVYGHAWMSAGATSAARDGEARVAVTSIGRRR